MSGKFTLQSFQCPKCGAALEVIPNQDVITCDYCNNTFNVQEKAQQAAPAPEPPKEARPKPNLEYQKVYVETQTKMIQQGRKTANFGALIGVVMTVAMVGFGAFMAMRAQKEVKSRQDQAQQQAENHRRAIKEQQQEREHKRWTEFAASNSEKLKPAKLDKVRKLVKELGIPFKGDKGAAESIYMFSRFTSTAMSRQNTFRKKMKFYQARFPKKFKWYFVPIPRDKRSQFRGVDALFEALLQQGGDVWWKLWRKQLSQSYWHFGIKDMAKLAKRVKLNEGEFVKALRTDVHKEKLDKLVSLAETLDLPDNEVSFIIKDTLFNNYSALSRIEYVMENTLGIK